MSFHMGVQEDKVLSPGWYEAVLNGIEIKQTAHGERLMWTFSVPSENVQVVGFSSLNEKTSAKPYYWASNIAGEIDPKEGWGPKTVTGKRCTIYVDTARDAQGRALGRYRRGRGRETGVPRLCNGGNVRGMGAKREGFLVLHPLQVEGWAGGAPVRRHRSPGGARRPRRRAKTPPKRSGESLLQRGAGASGTGCGFPTRARGGRANSHPGAPRSGRLPQTQWRMETTT